MRNNDGEPIRWYKTAWWSACVRAGLAHWKDPEHRKGYVGPVVHDLRRTAVRNLERAGVPRSVAMKLTGHKTEAVYRRYAIVVEADLREGVEKLARLHHTEPTQKTKVSPLRHTSGTVGPETRKTAVGRQS